MIAEISNKGIRALTAHVLQNVVLRNIVVGTETLVTGR